MNAPTKCLHCKSNNIIGPYKYFTGGGVEISRVRYIRQNAFICADCGYTMLFTREGDEKKVLKELLEKQTELG